MWRLWRTVDIILFVVVTIMGKVAVFVRSDNLLDGDPIGVVVVNEWDRSKVDDAAQETSEMVIDADEECRMPSRSKIWDFFVDRLEGKVSGRVEAYPCQEFVEIYDGR